MFYEKFNNKENLDKLSLRIFSAAGMELNKSDSVCKLNELLIDLMVYTSLPFSYNLSVVEAENVNKFQRLQTYLNNSRIRISNLKADTNYSVTVS